MRKLMLLSAYIVGFCATFLFVPRAAAEWTVCNKTGYPVVVAMGYKEDDRWISKGWWHIAGGYCSEIISGDLENRYYYYYAEQVGFTGKWGGDASFCVSQNSFTIVGDQNCESRGYERKGFRTVDTGDSKSWTTSLVDN